MLEEALFALSHRPLKLSHSNKPFVCVTKQLMLDKRNPGLCFSSLNGAVWAARPFTKQLALNCSLLLAFCLWICETLWAALQFWGQWPLWDGVYWGPCFAAVLTAHDHDGLVPAVPVVWIICSLQKLNYGFVMLYIYIYLKWSLWTINSWLYNIMHMNNAVGIFPVQLCTVI